MESERREVRSKKCEGELRADVREIRSKAMEAHTTHCSTAI